MAERKTGPVKPPTLDLKARTSDAEADAPKADKAQAETAAAPVSRTPDSAPRARASERTGKADGGETNKPGDGPAKPKATKKSDASSPNGQSTAIIAGVAGALVGGVLGLGGAYGLAQYGYWPGSASDAAASLREELSGLYVKRSDIGAVVDRAVSEVRAELANVEPRIAALETASAPADLSPLETRLETLDAQLADLSQKLEAAMIASGDPQAAETLAAIATRLDDLSASVTALDAREIVAPESVTSLETSLGAVQSGLSAVTADVDAIKNAPEPAPVDLRLPLALSGLTEALVTGAPFSRELALIRAALPNMSIPDEVTFASAQGLGAPGALEAQFLAKVPDILAAKPADASASWSDQALDRLKALVALRPVATSDDTSPEGLVSRIEAALMARDFAVASAAFAALPQPMQAASGGLGRNIDRFAATAELVTRARSEALALAGSQS